MLDVYQRVSKTIHSSCRAISGRWVADISIQDSDSNVTSGEILQKIHKGHFVINKCKEHAQTSVWWSGISKDIEQKVAEPYPIQRTTDDVTIAWSSVATSRNRTCVNSKDRDILWLWTIIPTISFPLS